ncbi:PIN domain-containing protein [Streptomyces scabiei]|uniref:PIN domain-containing protein n=1 Tax=Streptomyces scabiei TaxID=1930 RepID=UPI0029A9AC1E|nr:PIN domain-containing protein [Streptomyces scabiei]MDX3522406.1 PIN domain-containing protein [Streptomyces scabiei]
MTSSFLSAFDGLWRRPAADYKLGVKEYLVSIDTNVLLQLYRFTPDARHELLDVLGRLGDRLWIPHQVASEYYNRRVDAVKEHLALYTSVPKSLEEARSKALQELHTFAKRCALSEADKSKLVSPIDAAFASTLVRIKKRGEAFDLSLEKVIDADPILESLARTLDGKTGNPFNAEEIEQLTEEAERRYDSKRPPGFKDASKSDNSYGDFFVWEQLLREASQRQTPTLFVTNDVKDDWFRKEAGLIVGAHPLLVKEFKERCGGADFLATPLGRFLQIAKEELGVTVSASTVAQAENIREAPRGEFEVVSLTEEEYDSLILDLIQDAQKWDAVLQDERLSAGSRNHARIRRDRSTHLHRKLENLEKNRSLDGNIHVVLQSRDWNDIQAALRRVRGKRKFSQDFPRAAEAEKELDFLRQERDRLTSFIDQLDPAILAPSLLDDQEDVRQIEAERLAAIQKRAAVEGRIHAVEGRIERMQRTQEPG